MIKSFLNAYDKRKILTKEAFIMDEESSKKKTSKTDAKADKKNDKKEEKKKKGNGRILFVIFVSFAIVIQLAILLIGLFFVNDVKEAQRIQAETEARANVIWQINNEAFQETNQWIKINYISNRDRSVQSYWHSQDRDFRLTIQSDSLNRMIKEGYLLFGEGTDGANLSLTVYFNPLRLANPSLEELTPIYQLIRYQKPELVQLKEQEWREWELYQEELTLTEEWKEKLNLNSSKKTSSSSQKTGSIEEEVMTEPEPLVTYYPFEENQILYENDQFVVFESIRVPEDDPSLNSHYYQSSLGPDSIFGDYGWESGIFYLDEAVNEEVDGAVETDSTVEAEEYINEMN